MDSQSRTLEEVRTDAREALQRIQVVNVAPVAISAELLDADRPAEGITYSVELQFRHGAGFFENRFRYDIKVVDAEKVPVAELAFTLRVEFDVESGYELPEGVPEFLTETTSYFAAYPYARELAQGLTTRLQLDPVVLGLLHHGSLDPSAVASVGQSGLEGQPD